MPCMYRGILQVLLHSFLISALDDVVGQRHGPVDLSQKTALVSIVQEAGRAL